MAATETSIFIRKNGNPMQLLEALDVKSQHELSRLFSKSFNEDEEDEEEENEDAILELLEEAKENAIKKSPEKEAAIENWFQFYKEHYCEESALTRNLMTMQLLMLGGSPRQGNDRVQLQPEQSPRMAKSGVGIDSVQIQKGSQLSAVKIQESFNQVITTADQALSRFEEQLQGVATGIQVKPAGEVGLPAKYVEKDWTLSEETVEEHPIEHDFVRSEETVEEHPIEHDFVRSEETVEEHPIEHDFRLTEEQIEEMHVERDLDNLRKGVEKLRSFKVEDYRSAKRNDMLHAMFVVEEAVEELQADVQELEIEKGIKRVLATGAEVVARQIKDQKTFETSLVKLFSELNNEIRHASGKARKHFSNILADLRHLQDKVKKSKNLEEIKGHVINMVDKERDRLYKAGQTQSSFYIKLNAFVRQYRAPGPGIAISPNQASKQPMLFGHSLPGHKAGELSKSPARRGGRVGRAEGPVKGGTKEDKGEGGGKPKV